MTPRVYGKGIADAFAAESKKLGGTVVGREGADPKTHRLPPILTKFKDLNPDSVFYGGVTANGGGLARKQMPQAGLGDLPYLGGDGIQDRRWDQGSFINIAGPAAANSSVRRRRDPRHPGRGRSSRPEYKAEFKDRPGRVQRLRLRLRADHHQGDRRRAAAKGDVTREAVRATCTDRPRRSRPSSAPSSSTRSVTPARRSSRSTRPTYGRRRQGRLGLRQADRLRRAVAAVPRLKRSRGAARVPGLLHPEATPMISAEPAMTAPAASADAPSAGRSPARACIGWARSPSSSVLLVGAFIWMGPPAVRERAHASARSTP